MPFAGAPGVAFEVPIYAVWVVGGFPRLCGQLDVDRCGCARRLGPHLSSLASMDFEPCRQLAALLAMLPNIAPRPQAITFLLLPLVAILLEKKRWGLALLLMVLGINVHGAFYPVYLVLFASTHAPKPQWSLPCWLRCSLRWVAALIWPLAAFDSSRSTSASSRRRLLAGTRCSLSRSSRSCF
jgi:hypothetical protein